MFTCKIIEDRVQLSLIRSIFQKFVIISNELYNQRSSFQINDWKIEIPERKAFFNIRSFLNGNNFVRFIYIDFNVPKIEIRPNRKNMIMLDLFYLQTNSNIIDRIDCTGHYWIDRNSFVTTNARICSNPEKQKLSPFEHFEIKSIIKLIHIFKVDRNFLSELDKHLSLSLVRAI